MERRVAADRPRSLELTYDHDFVDMVREPRERISNARAATPDVEETNR